MRCRLLLTCFVCYRNCRDKLLSTRAVEETLHARFLDFLSRYNVKYDSVSVRVVAVKPLPIFGG